MFKKSLKKIFGRDPDKLGEELMSALERGNNDELVKTLIRRGANPNWRDIYGRTPLMWATCARHDSTEILDLLIAAGADLNAQSTFRNTALIWAVFKEHKRAVKKLLAAGADLDIQGEIGRTALDLAKQYRDTEIVKLIEAEIVSRKKQAEANPQPTEADLIKIREIFSRRP